MEDNKDVPPLVEPSLNQSEDADSDGWDEMEVAGEQTTCLFCPLQFLTIAVALDHCRTEHNFDLLELKTRYNMDCYSYIKMINYIRLQKPDPKTITESSTALWEDDVYLKPGETESWLMYDFDDLGSAPSTPHYAIDGKTPISNINYSDLQRQIQDLTIEVRHKDILLQKALKDITKMREVTRTIVEAGDSHNNALPNCIENLPLSSDSSYFNSYSHFAIHHEMLNDKVRTESYRDAFFNNKSMVEGKTVLDLGCGTGILSLFAAKAGAAKVYGIDQSDIVYKAMDIVRENNLHEQIHLLRGRIEDTNLPVEKVDILVSEWMGYFLLFEGMLDSFIYARDNHLATDGLLIPNRCTMSIVGCSDIEGYNGIVNFWDDVYGFKMQTMKSEVLHEPFLDTIPSEKVITSANLLKEINLYTCDIETCQFSAEFSLEALSNGTLTCLVGYFDTFFDLENPVSFSTGPHAKKTHWQQSIFYLRTPLDVNTGDIVKGKVTCSRTVKNLRGLSITIEIGDEKNRYIFG